MKKVRKAIIPAAGLGTRFLPATKTIPKEMFPIVDTPIIYYIVDECIRAGIEDIIFIQGRGKSAIEDFFDHSVEVEAKIEKDGKTHYLQKVYEMRNSANFISIRQKVPMGLGHAVLCGAPIVGDEPFAVLLGDEIMISKANEPTVTKQLSDWYEKSGLSTVAVMEVPESDTVKYGIVAIEDPTQKPFKVTDVVEKPKAGTAPSNFALPGRYVFDSRIFNYLKNTKPGRLGEIQLTDGMTSLAQRDGLLATTFVAKRYDAGDKLGFLQANIEMALNSDELGNPLRSYLRQLVKTL